MQFLLFILLCGQLSTVQSATTIAVTGAVAIKDQATVTLSCVITAGAAPAKHGFKPDPAGSFKVNLGTYAGGKVTDTLVIENPQSDETFTCFADSTNSVAVKTDVITIATESSTIVAGQAGTIKCTATGYTAKATKVEVSYGGKDYAATADTVTITHTEDGTKQIVKFSATGISADVSPECKYTFSTNSVKKAVKVDFITVSKLDLAVREGTAPTIKCAASGVITQPSDVWITFGGTTYKKTTSPAVAFTDQAGGACKAQVVLAAQSADADAVCVFKFTSQDQTVTQKLDAVLMVMSAIYTEVGTAATFTCTVTKLLKDPSGGLTFKNGTTSWTKTESDSKVIFKDIAYASNKKESKLTISSPAYDSTYSCVMTYGASSLSLPANLDVFTISSAGFSLISGATATLTCSITGVATKPASVGWGDVTKTHDVTKDAWASSTGTWRTTLEVQSITADTTFTCTYVVNSVSFTDTALADVVVLTGFGKKIWSGGTTGPKCTLAGSQTAPTSLTFTNSDGTFSAGSFSGGGQNISSTRAYTTDKTYICQLKMSTNTLTTTAIVDVVVFDYKKVAYNKGAAQPALTCQTSQVVDISATTISWKIGSTTYTKADTTKVADTLTASLHKSVLSKISYTADFKVYCYIVYSTSTIYGYPTHDFLELTSDAATVIVQKGNETSVWCELIKAQDTYAISWGAAKTNVTIKTTAVTNGRLSTLTYSNAQADATYTCAWTYTSSSLGLSYSFSEKPAIDVIETVATGDFVEAGSSATVTCKVTGAGSTAQLNFEIGGKNYTKAKSETKDSYTIAHGTFSSGALTSTVIGIFSNDTTVNCYATVGGSDFKMNSAVDTFVLSSNGFTTVKDDAATIWSQIAGSLLVVKSHEIQWSTDLQIENSAKWYGWKADPESHNSSLSVSKVGADIIYTCTFTVNKKPWTTKVPIDVIEKRVTVTNVRVGSATSLVCGMEGSANNPKSVWFTTAGNSNKINTATNKATGLEVVEVAYKASDGTMTSTLNIAKASADTVYTCFTEFNTNTLSWELKSDTFTVATSSHVTVKGTTASVTCTVTGSDVAPSAWKWKIGATTHSKDSGNYVLKAGAYADKAQSHVLTLAKQAADQTVTCMVIVDSREYLETVKIDIIEIEMVKTTVLTDASASITCKMSGYDSSTAPTDIWYDYSGSAYKASTTIAGNTVTKTAYADGKQEAKLAVAKATSDKTYTCHYKFPLNTITSSVTIDVYTIVINGIYEVPINNYAMFTCTVDRSETKPSKMSWLIGSKAVASPIENADYTVTEVAYSSQKMISVLKIKKITVDSNIKCLTKIEFDGETPVTFVDVYSFSKQATIGFNNYNSTSVMLIKDIKKNIDKSRIKWGTTNSFAALGASDYSFTNTYDATKKQIVIRLAIKATVGKTQNYFIKMDNVAAYVSDSSVDIGKITIEPASINIINGTSYNFAATITEFTADYTSKVHWSLNNKAFNPTSNAWNATSKTLTTTAHAAGATDTESVLTFTMKNNYAQAVNTAAVHVADMTVTEHTRLTAGETLTLVCTLTNILADPTTLVWWSNRGKNITGPTQSYSGTKFTSTLKVASYNHTDQVYTCFANVAKTISQRKAHVWQYVYFPTNVAVSAKTASTVLTCKVSGSKNKPSKWTWTPERTSILFKQSESAWNASEGSQESYVTITNIAHDSGFSCEATIAGYTNNAVTKTKLQLQADIYDVKIMGDMMVGGKDVKVVQKGKTATFVIDFIDLTLPTNGTVTFGSKKYYTWKKESGYSFTDMPEKMMDGKKIKKVMFKIDTFDGSSGVMEFESSQETPPQVVPQKTLAHVIKKQLEIKFFTTTVTANAIITTGDNTKLTCSITATGVNATDTMAWVMVPPEKGQIYGKLNVTTTYAAGKTSAVLETPKVLTNATTFHCNVGEYSYPSNIWYFETKGTNATAIANTSTTLSCGVEGSKNAPVDIYWTDKAAKKYETKSSIAGYKVTNTAFITATGVQTSSLAITKPASDQTWTCVVQVTSGFKTNKVLAVDVIAITGKDVELLKGGTAVVSVTVSGINSHSMKEMVSFTSKKSGTVHHAMKGGKVTTSPVLNNTQQFNLTLANQLEDEDFTFSLKTPLVYFNKTFKVDVIEMTLTHGQGYSGTEMTLTCAVSGVSGDPNFLWSVDGKVQSGSADAETAYSASKGTKSSTWKTGKLTKTVSYTCKVEIVSSGTTYIKDTYYNIYALAMKDATIIDGNIRTLTCTITGASQATLDLLEWTNKAGNTKYTTFKSTYGKTESTSVLTTTSYGDIVCKIEANKVQATLDIVSVACTTGSAEVNTSSTITCTYSSIETDLTKSIAWNVTSGVTAEATYAAGDKTIIATLTIAKLSADTTYLVTLTSQDGYKQTKVAKAQVLGASLSNPNPTQETAGAKFTITCNLKGASKAPTESYYLLDGTTKINTSNSMVTSTAYSAATGSMSLLYVGTNTGADITTLKCVFVVKPATKAVTLTVPFTVDALDFTASTPVIMSKGAGSQNISCTYGKTEKSLEQRSIVWEKSGAVVTGAKITGTKASTTSTLTVKDLSADTAYICKLACNPTKILKTITVKTWSLTITAEQYKTLGTAATVKCNLVTSVLSKKATFVWKNGGSALSAGGVVAITTDTNKQWSKVVISKVELHYKLECTVVENGYTLQATSDIWVQHVDTKVMSIPGTNNQYKFSCILTGFTAQPVPTYWSLGATKYYPESGTSTISVTTDNWGDKTGQLHLLQTESSTKISADVTYTCNVVIASTTISKAATLDHITATADTTSYIMKGLDLTLTTTFTGVNADYSTDVFWQRGSGSTKALYTKAVPNGQTVTTQYNSVAKTLKTVLTMKAYTLGDQTIFATLNRTDTNLNAKTNFTVDQFEMSFSNAYFTTNGDVAVACSATGTAKAVKSITVSSGSLKFTQTSKTGTSMNGKLGSVTADATMKCVLDMEGTKLERTAKLEKLSISLSKQTWSNGNAQFSATLDAISFDIENDIHWFVSGVEVKSGITNKYTTGIKIASMLTVKGTHADGNVTLTVGGSGSAATASQTLDYYFLEMPVNVRVEKGKAVTVSCSVKSITTGLKSLKLKTTAKPFHEISTDKYTASLVLSNVASNNTIQCTATFADNVLTETSSLTVYDISMKVNGAAYTKGSLAWVTLNAKCSLECDMSTLTPATDVIKSVGWTKRPTTNTGTAVTQYSSNKTYALYTKTMTIEETFTCTFNFDGFGVEKKFTIVTKGCQMNSVTNGSFTPTTTLPKIAPNTVLNFKCANSTKYQLTGNSAVKCTDVQDATPKAEGAYYLKYNATWPTCKFVGDCADARSSFSSGSISPAYPFVNNQKYTFKCNEGYVLFGEDKVECKGDNWTGARPKCEAIISSCNDNDWGKAYGNKEGPYVAGDEITVFCSTGYTNAGASKLTCSKNGWDKVANCTQKPANQCSKIHPSSGEMKCTKDGKTVTQYTEGVLCKIECGSGYKAVGKTEGTTCAKNGTWSETTFPSCAQLTPPSIRKQKIDVTYGATYCVNADQVSKMNTAFVSALKSTYKIACLVMGKCEVSDMTCTPATSKFTVSFNLKQIKDMSNTTVLSLSTAEITKKGKAGLSVTVAAAKKKRTNIVKRASDQSYSSNGASNGAQVSTCSSNTILENNLCTSCPAGYYKNSATCSPCAVSSYNEAAGATSCKACTSSKTTLYAASTSATACSTLCTTPYVKHTNSSNVPQGSKVEDGALVSYECDDGYRHKDSAYYVCDPTIPEDQRTPVCEDHNSKLILYLCLGIGGFFLIIILIILIIFCCGLKVKVKVKENTDDDYILENKSIYSNDEYKPRAEEARYGPRAASVAGPRAEEARYGPRVASVAGSQAPSRYGHAGGRPMPSNAGRTANSRI